MSEQWAEATTADGKKFYYHKVTRQSVWEKPDELKTPQELAASASSSSTASSSSPSSTNTSTSLPPNWKEYVAENGKKYYHNTVTNETKWELPTSSSPPPPTNEQQPAAGKESTSSITSPSSSGGDEAVAAPIITDPKELAFKTFKELLMSHDVASSWSFEKAQRVIINDERYQVLKTMSERKAAFQEYMIDRKKYEYEEKKKQDKKNREAFIKLLKESSEVTSSMSWRRASLYFDGDPRWMAIDREVEREDLFRMTMIELEKKEKEEKEAAKKDLMKQIRAKFEANLTITSRSQWRKVKEEYENDPLISTCDKYDVLQVYESYIRELEKKEDDALRADKEAIKKEARIHRDNYRDFLNEKYNQGEIHAYTRWKEFYKQYHNHDVVVQLANQIVGSTPLELFSDFIEELESKYEKDFKRLKAMTQDVNFQFNSQPPQTTLEDFKQAISSHEKFSSISILNTIPFFEYLKEREEKKQKDSIKKRNRAVLNYKSLLEDTRTISKHSTWDEIKPTICKDPHYIELDDEEEKAKIFQEYLEFLSQEESDEEGIIKNDEELSSRKEFSSKKRYSRDGTDNITDDRKKKESKHT